MRWPAIGLRSHFWFDAVEHWFDSSNYGVKLVPLGPSVLLQHIELCLDPPMVVCKYYKVPSIRKVTLVVTPTKGILTVQLLDQLASSPCFLCFLLSELLEGLA